MARPQPGPALPSLRPLVTSSEVAGGVKDRLDPDPRFQQGTSGSWPGLLGDRGSADRAKGQAERGGSSRITQQWARLYQDSIRPPPTDPRTSRPVGHSLPLQIGSLTTRQIGAHSRHSLNHEDTWLPALKRASQHRWQGAFPRAEPTKRVPAHLWGTPQGLERAPG